MKGFVWLAKRVDELEDRVEILEERLKGHNAIDSYYISLIHDCVEQETRDAVMKALQCPIEMTVSDIEKAFGHKIKIVETKDRE